MALNINHWAQQLERWMTTAALPLWVEKGFDRASGCAHERLNLHGLPDTDCPKRVRVQARQMFVLSCASRRGWVAGADAIVADLDRFVTRYAQHPSAPDVYVHVLNSQNGIHDPRQDVYDLAFFLLACAWRFRAFNDVTALRKSEALIQHLDAYIKGPRGGWLEGDYSTGTRRQNPHMHLLEAFIALYDVTGDGRWLARSGEIFALFENSFYDSHNGVLLEYFHEDWSPLSEDEGQEVEPGHMLEWVWLLHQYSKRSGAPVGRYTETLYRRALELGMEAETGLIYDAVSPQGRILKASKRCWPLTELIKASLCQASTGDQQAEVDAARGIHLLFKYYFDKKIPGLYVDQLDAENRVINNLAPASTLYHLMVATTEAVDYSAAAKLKMRAAYGAVPG